MAEITKDPTKKIMIFKLPGGQEVHISFDRFHELGQEVFRDWAAKKAMDKARAYIKEHGKEPPPDILDQMIRSSADRVCDEFDLLPTEAQDKLILDKITEKVIRENSN